MRKGQAMNWLEEIDARAEAATEEPWEVTGISITTLRPDNSTIGATWRKSWTTGQSVEDSINNATFIAHARHDIPRLLDMVKRMKEALEIYADPADFYDEETFNEKTRALLTELEKQS